MGLGIGPLELGMVLLVALLVFGPHRLPQITNSVGRALSEFRRAAGQLTADLSQDMRPQAPVRREAPPTEGERQPPPPPAAPQP